MQITEALKILEPLLENQGNFPVRVKKGFEDLGRVESIVSSGECKACLIPEKSPNDGEYLPIREIYDALSKLNDCELTVNGEPILNLANGLSSMGSAMYFGGCSVYV